MKQIRPHPVLILWAAIFAAVSAWCVFGAPLASIDAHYSDGSKVSTTAPSVLTAAGNAIAATQPAPATKPAVVVAPPVTPPISVLDHVGTQGQFDAIEWGSFKEIVLGGGSFSIHSQIDVPGSASILVHPSDPDHPATISLPGDSLPSLDVNGTIKITGFKITGGAKAVLLQSHGKANVDLENLDGDACCLFWGEGGNAVSVLNCVVAGKPNQYGLCNFDAPLANLHVSGCTIAQGPNQAAIRLMEVTTSLVENTTFIGSDFKQCIQDRSGGTHIWKNVTVKCTAGHGWTGDIGPMSWQKYDKPADVPDPLALSEWINCTLPDYPSVERPGGKKTVQRILYQTCTMGGDKNVNKDFN